MLPHFFQTPWRLSNIINAFRQGSRCFGLSTWCSCSPCWCALFLVSCGRRRSQFFLLRIVDDKMLQVETGWMFPWFWKMPNCSNSRGFIGRWTDISSVTNAQGITGLHPTLRKDATCSWLFSLFNIAAHSVYIEYKHHIGRGWKGAFTENYASSWWFQHLHVLGGKTRCFQFLDFQGVDPLLKLLN